MITNFISKSLEFIELVICKQIAEVFLFKRNEKKNRRGTLTPKCLSLPDSRFPRLSISIQYYNTFRGGYDYKCYIKIFGIYRTIDL